MRKVEGPRMKLFSCLTLPKGRCDIMWKNIDVKAKIEFLKQFDFLLQSLLSEATV